MARDLGSDRSAADRARVGEGAQLDLIDAARSNMVSRKTSKSPRMLRSIGWWTSACQSLFDCLHCGHCTSVAQDKLPYFGLPADSVGDAY